MYVLDLISPGGVELNLISDGAPGGLAVEAGGVEGLTGMFQDTPVQAVGEPGQFVNFSDRVVNPITGSLTVRVLDPEQWGAFRRAWSVWDTSILRLTIDGTVFRLPCRLQSSFSFPASIPKRNDAVQVPIISDRPGAWLVAYSGAGLVTVTNSGDIPVSPVIAWNGAGGKVTLPSGAYFTLPAVTSEHTLPMARSNSGRVLDATGAPVASLTRAVGAVGERVPRGAQLLYSLPPGARLDWDVGYFDPFREV